MSDAQIIAALSPLFAVFCDVSTVKWDQYTPMFVGTTNPGDMDDAIESMRKSHAFRNAPLPAEVLAHITEAKRNRIARRYRPDREQPIDPNEGELKEITVKGVGTLKLRVLPDEHPSLRVSCLDCHDSGWKDVPHSPEVQRTVARCHCWRMNPVLQRQREQSARFVKERSER